MLKRFLNRLRVYSSVLKVLYKYKEVWDANVGFVEIVTDVETNVKAIDAAHTETSKKTNGITEDKNTLGTDIVDLITEISGSFGAYATRIGNHELYGKVYFTETDLFQMTELEFANKTTEFALLAKQYGDVLARYDFTSEEIAHLQELCAAYSNKMLEPRELVTVRSAVHVRLRALFAETNLLFKKQLDGAVDRYKRKHPDFWNAYYNARKNINYGTRHESDTDDGADTGVTAK